MKRIFTPLMAVFIAVTMSYPVSAQLQFPGFLPTECEQQAIDQLDNASDAKVAAIITVGATVPIGEIELDLAFDLDDGTSPLWIYAVTSESLDTIAIVPMFRLLGICNVTPLDDVGDIGTELGLSSQGLPESYSQGKPLMDFFKKDPSYQAFTAAYPDSTPSFAALGSVEEGFGEFPAGSPFWILQWGTTQLSAFTCVSHAITGETLCFGDTPSSVSEDARSAGFHASPNPAQDLLIVTVPETWVGTTVSINAVSTAGHTIPLLASRRASSQQLVLSVVDLPTGFWSLQVVNGAQAQTIPLSIVR